MVSLMKTKEYILGIEVAVINENIRNFVPENNLYNQSWKNIRTVIRARNTASQ